MTGADMDDLTLRPATRDDLPVLMAIERLPGYEALVGSFGEERHLANLADPGMRHLLCMAGDRTAGFAVLTGYGHPWGAVNIHRIAVSDGGKGIGTRFTRMVCDHVFADPGIFRIALDVLPGNVAARRVYGRVGFVEEGLMRQALRYPDGRRADLILMSLLRPDWEAMRRG